MGKNGALGFTPSTVNVFWGNSFDPFPFMGGFNTQRLIIGDQGYVGRAIATVFATIGDWIEGHGLRVKLFQE